MKIKLLISLFTIAFLFPASILGCNNTRISEKGDNVVPEPAIPPIDIAAPTNTETATFALG